MDERTALARIRQLIKTPVEKIDSRSSTAFCTSTAFYTSTTFYISQFYVNFSCDILLFGSATLILSDFFEMAEAEKTVDPNLLDDSALTVLLCIFWTAEVLWLPGIILLGFYRVSFVIAKGNINCFEDSQLLRRSKWWNC